MSRVVLGIIIIYRTCKPLLLWGRWSSDHTQLQSGPPSIRIKHNRLKIRLTVSCFLKLKESITIHESYFDPVLCQWSGTLQWTHWNDTNIKNLQNRLERKFDKVVCPGEVTTGGGRHLVETDRPHTSRPQPTGRTRGRGIRSTGKFNRRGDPEELPWKGYENAEEWHRRGAKEIDTPKKSSHQGRQGVHRPLETPVMISFDSNSTEGQGSGTHLPKLKVKKESLLPGDTSHSMS